MAKPTPQGKAVLQTTGEKVKNCVIIRKDRKGNFYWVSVFANGNYGDKVGNLSETAAACKAKIKSSFNFWKKKVVTSSECGAATSVGGIITIYNDFFHGFQELKN